ncbi:hypothetical protein PMAYCL1PPCAC_08417, partial [Pristionchus mayeri]
MDTALTVLADVVILATFPLHCRYLSVMLQKGAKYASLEYAFRATLTNLVVANLLYFIVFILVQEPAAYGIFVNFYKDNSWWLGKLFIMQSVPLILLMAFFHILIAINRVSALINPMAHMQFWSEGRINRIIIVFWVVTMLECLPLVYPFEDAYCIRISPVRTEGVALVIVGELPNLIYQEIAVAIGGLFEIITIVLYVFVGCRVNKLK